MQVWEAVVLAMQQLRTEKLKSFFSVIGVILGVMFLIVVVTIIEGLDRYVREEVTAQVFGISTVTLRRWPEVDLNTDEERWRRMLRAPRLRYEDADAIRAQLTIPARIAIQSSSGGTAVGDNGRTATGVQLIGASPEVFPIRDLTIDRGRAFSEQEATAGVPVLVLGFQTSEVLFEELDPIGHTVRLRGFPYRVIGVLEERGSLFGMSLDNFAIAPALSPIKAVLNPPGIVDEVIIQTVDPDRLREAQMEAEGSNFEDVLADAQQMGYAEAEPSLDVDGFDTQHKTGILASLAHGFWVKPSQIFVEGIRHITPLDIQFARRLGYCIKLLGIVKKLRGKVQIAVHPALVPETHVLANVSDVFNAILVRGDIVGDTLHYGQGAGADATASAVLSDLADAALDLKNGSIGRVPPFVPHDQDGAVLPMDKAVSPFYLRLSVIDRPGTLAKIAAILGEMKIGICSVTQPEGHVGESVPLILMLHDAPDLVMRQALRKIARLSAIKAKPTMIRVETFE